MDVIVLYIGHFVELSIAAGPWLVLGLVIAGLMHTWLPSEVLTRHLGNGRLAVVKAALVGAPLPLCSCGVIPVATQLRRSGASASSTASFLVATPETGIDSVSVSYAMLGPVMAVYRPISAIISAIFTGYLVSTTAEPAAKAQETSSCCSGACSSNKISVWGKLVSSIKYAFTKLLDDLFVWLLVGLLFAAAVRTFIPETFLLSYGSGLLAMLVMIALSVPMYICATASTPVAAGLIMAGISPGTALVFMMCGPATNVSTLGVIRKEMGAPVLVRYLMGIIVSSIASAYLLDWGLGYLEIDIGTQMSHSHELLPAWVGISSALLLLVCSRPVRRNWRHSDYASTTE